MSWRTVIALFLGALAASAATAPRVPDGGPPAGELRRAASAFTPDPAEDGPTIPTGADRRPRPDEAPSRGRADDAVPHPLAIFNDYATAAHTHAGRHAVVHYVTVGMNAPPLNDDDVDGVPDYVERAAEAADTAVAYFERRGFRSIRRDHGGPDGRPDIYISRFAAGTFGVAFPDRDAVGGAFVAVANTLDQSQTDALGSLYGTVAHELFHLVQFSYFAADSDPVLPEWILEGTAAAFERRVHPEVRDIVSALQLRRWFGAPHRPLTAQSYGGQLLWRDLDERHPKLVPTLLTRLAARPAAGDGSHAFLTTFRHVTGRPFAPTFHAFTLRTAAEHFGELAFRPTFAGGSLRASVAPLAVHYVRLRPRRASGGYTLAVRLGPGAAAARASLVYDLESETAGNPPGTVHVRPRVSGGSRTLVFPIPRAALRNPRFSRPVLVVSNGGRRPAAYRVTAR